MKYIRCFIKQVVFLNNNKSKWCRCLSNDACAPVCGVCKMSRLQKAWPLRLLFTPLALGEEDGMQKGAANY